MLDKGKLPPLNFQMAPQPQQMENNFKMGRLVYKQEVSLQHKLCVSLTHLFFYVTQAFRLFQ